MRSSSLPHLLACALTGEGHIFVVSDSKLQLILFLKHWRNTTTMTSHRIGRHESGIERSCMRADVPLQRGTQRQSPHPHHEEFLSSSPPHDSLVKVALLW